MKKNLLLPLLLATALLAGCGKSTHTAAPSNDTSKSSVQKEETASEAEEEIEEESKPEVEETNETSENVTFEDMVAATGCKAVLPPNSTILDCSLNEEGLGEVNYTTLGGFSYWTLRVQKTDSFTDISPIECDWNEETFGKRKLEDKYLYSEYCNVFDEDSYDFDVCLWYDEEDSLMYSLSVKEDNVDGLDIGYTVLQMMQVYEFSENTYPLNALEERAGKCWFESYDEIIGLLANDETYIYKKIKGHDGDVLIINTGRANADGSSEDRVASIYSSKSNGKVVCDYSYYLGEDSTLAIDDNGAFFEIYKSGGVTKDYYVENLIGDSSLVSIDCVYVWQTDDEGKPVSAYGSYFDTTNPDSIIGDTYIYSEEEIPAALEKLQAEAALATPLEFPTMMDL